MKQRQSNSKTRTMERIDTGELMNVMRIMRRSRLSPTYTDEQAILNRQDIARDFGDTDDVSKHWRGEK